MRALATRLANIVGRPQFQCEEWALQVHSSETQTMLCEIRFASFESLEEYIVEHKEQGCRDRLIMRLPSNASDAKLGRLFWLGVHFLFE
jgi:hypothetical protein